MALRRLGTSRISRGFMALLKLATMNIFTAYWVDMAKAWQQKMKNS